MQLSDGERDVVSGVVQRFFNLKELTPRKPLIIKLKSVESLERLVTHGYLKTASPGAYLPGLRGIECCGDAAFVRVAKHSAAVVLHTLKNLYELEWSKDEFAPADVEAQARKIYDTVEPGAIRLGLYLLQEFPVFSSWAGSPGEITSFHITEHIVQVTDIEAEWDKRIASYRESDRFNDVTALAPELPPVPPPAPVSRPDIDWRLIHQEIRDVARSRFESGHHADAAEAAFKHLNERVRALVKERTGREWDGADLMRRAFSPNQPVLRMDDDPTSMTGKSVQEGYMHIFEGAMMGIRNPKAHGIVQIAPLRATHFLFLASLLMMKLDEALVREASSKASTVPTAPCDPQPQSKKLGT